MAGAKRDTLATKPLLLRATKARGSEITIDPTGGYKSQGIIRGVSVVMRGEALGHGFWLDEYFVTDTASRINAASKLGIKARFTHPGLSSDGLGSYLGRIMDASTDGDKTIADFHFSEAGHKSPDGDLASYVMDLAAEDPEAFGLSIVFEPDEIAEMQFTGDHSDDRNGFVSPDADNKSNLPHARMQSLRAADVVDEPAANPDGLFHREQQFAQEATAIASYALGLSADRPALVSLGLDADRVAGFVKRFLSDNSLEIRKMKTLNDGDAGATEDEGKTDKPAEVTTPTTEDKPALTGGARFVEAFGDKGAVWFVEGKTFEQAAALHSKAQAARIAELEAGREDDKKRLAAAQATGEPEPLEFGSGDKKEQKRKGFAGKIRFAGAPAQ